MGGKRSTANFISYDLRPTKQCERKILIEILKIAGDNGLPIRDYRYIGMGANRFYDFLLVHKYLGVSRMISLEHDKKMFKRAAFNVPYGFIDVQRKTSSTFIASDSFATPSIVWLDYDGGINGNVIEDISSLGTKSNLGDFCFVTLYGDPPGALHEYSAQKRLEWYRDELGDVSSEVNLSDVENASFYRSIHKSLVSAFNNAFAYRKEGEFVLLMGVQYSDSSPMITVGGAFLETKQKPDLVNKVAQSLPFLHRSGSHPYEIRSFHLTEKEKHLFDRAITSGYHRSQDAIKLIELGFKEEDFEAYRDLFRFIPRYVEAVI